MINFKREKNPSLPQIGFLQAGGLLAYCFLVAMIMWRGDELFGKADTYMTPVMVLTLFVVSALICALISLGYPSYLALEKKRLKDALTVIYHTALWLVFALILLMGYLLVIKQDHSSPASNQAQEQNTDLQP